MADFTEFVRAIPNAASSPAAFAAYAIAALCNVAIGLKTKRNKQLLASLSALPENQRLKALELEMGIRGPITPQQADDLDGRARLPSRRSARMPALPRRRRHLRQPVTRP